MKIIRSSGLSFIPASHEDPVSPGVVKKVLFGPGSLPEGAVQMVNWAKLFAGKSVARHSHATMLELFIVLEGSVEIRVDGRTESLGPGDAAFVGAGEDHTLLNPHDGDALFIAVGIVPHNPDGAVGV